MTLLRFSISLLLLSLPSATINIADVNVAITVVDQLDPDRLKGVWFEAIVSALPVPEYCTVYEFGSLYKKRNQVLFNTTKMFRAGSLSLFAPASLQYAHFVSEVSPNEQSTIVVNSPQSFSEQEAIMHRIGTKQYHRIDNEFLVMYGTYPVSVLVRYPDVFNQKYATIVLGWFDTSIQHMVHPANYSACHYSPFSVFKLPEDISNSDASTDSNPDPATAITNNFVELGIDWLTTNSYRDAIVETTGDYFDVYPATAMTDSHDTAVESVTTNGYPVTEVEVTRADILDTGSTPDQKSDPIVDGATTLS